MRFPTLFKRVLPAGPSAKTLGSDVLPVDAGSNPRPANTKDDNTVIAKNANMSGWPTHRIAVTYYTDAGSPVDLTAHMYFFEEGSGQWYLIGTGTLKVGTVTFFDIISLADPPQTKANIVDGNSAGNSGSITQLLIIDKGSAPDGNYVFTMGPDLTTFP